MDPYNSYNNNFTNNNYNNFNNYNNNYSNEQQHQNRSNANIQNLLTNSLDNRQTSSNQFNDFINTPPPSQTSYNNNKDNYNSNNYNTSSSSGSDRGRGSESESDSSSDSNSSDSDTGSSSISDSESDGESNQNKPQNYINDNNTSNTNNTLNNKASNNNDINYSNNNNHNTSTFNNNNNNNNINYNNSNSINNSNSFNTNNSNSINNSSNSINNKNSINNINGNSINNSSNGINSINNNNNNNYNNNHSNNLNTNNVYYSNNHNDSNNNKLITSTNTNTNTNFNTNNVNTNTNINTNTNTNIITNTNINNMSNNDSKNQNPPLNNQNKPTTNGVKSNNKSEDNLKRKLNETNNSETPAQKVKKETKQSKSKQEAIIPPIASTEPQQQPPPPPPQVLNNQLQLQLKPVLDFPYNISALTWDLDHLSNKENCYCYCGKDKERIMIRCDLCKQMFHIHCIRLLEGSHQLYGDWVYRFTCSVCNEDTETFERFSKNWVDILEITLFNLTQSKIDQFEKLERKPSNSPVTYHQLKSNVNENYNMDEINFINLKSNSENLLKKGIYFHLDEEIVPFIEKNWNLLCSDKKKKAQWQKQLPPALVSGRIFKSGFINYGKTNMWALGTDQLLLKDNSMFKDKVLAPLHRNSRKKGKKSSAEEDRDKYITRLLLIPTKEGIYIPTIEFDTLCIAKTNSAPQIVPSDNKFLTVCNNEGYRMVRSSFPCVYGEWYYEIDILPPTKVLEKPYACRLGWSTPKGDCQANVGYDYFSYGYRSTHGDIFHNARSKSYGDSYTQGDTIGFYINLPSPYNNSTNDKDKSKQLQQYEKEKEFPYIKQLDIYEMISNDLALSSDKPLKSLQGSFIQFFKNGVSPGPAFNNIGKSFYYPAASLYMGANIKFNFGPNFKYPPPSHLNPKPFCFINNKSNN